MAEKKKTKTKVNVRDLKPKKDAKGGRSVDLNLNRQAQFRAVQGATKQG